MKKSAFILAILMSGAWAVLLCAAPVSEAQPVLLEGKASPTLGLIQSSDSIFEVEIVQAQPRPDLEKMEDKELKPELLAGFAKVKILRIFKGSGRQGDTIDVDSGKMDWNVGGRSIVFLRNGKKMILSYSSKSELYKNFMNTFGAYNGQLSPIDENVKTAALATRKALENKCAAVKGKDNKAKCQTFLRHW